MSKKGHLDSYLTLFGLLGPSGQKALETLSSAPNGLVARSGFLKLPRDFFQSLSGKTREGWNCRFQKTPRTEGWDKVPGVSTKRSRQGCLSPVPEVLEFVAFRDSGKFFQQYSRDFPGVFLGNPRTHPTNSHSLLEFSDFGPSGIVRSADSMTGYWRKFCVLPRSHLSAQPCYMLAQEAWKENGF